MMTTKKNKERNESSTKEQKDLFGLNPDESLLSVKFATTENRFLNEYPQLENPDQV
ncbi:hypothetical protein [Halalkalibacter alkalisediminis]|uniref:Uncharacterized protein n=1 Tax=Halalkalibacter alkalisediminis TaxID=935616 RepID=A0ABV6NJ07_9BACI|nr:hypothetical protein [Halalkalibacter alkalisediminis]